MASDGQLIEYELLKTGTVLSTIGRAPRAFAGPWAKVVRRNQIRTLLMAPRPSALDMRAPTVRPLIRIASKLRAPIGLRW
jgi:hypothetical protein